MTDRATELERLENRQRVQRYRMRKAGLLPPLPLCPNCGAQCRTDRWLSLCSNCARARPLRLAADAIIRQLRAEAREGI